MALSKLILTGTSYERGVKHGEAFADEIRDNVRVYLNRFDEYGLPEAEARELAADYVPVFEAENEEFSEEMKGIAAGAELPVEDVALINARYELIYGAFSNETRSGADAVDDEAASDGCTSFGLTPEVTADGHTYLGQNWDWIHQLTENVFVMDVRRDDGPNLVALTEAGIATGRKGVNEHGIGFVANGLVTPDDGANTDRKPYMVRCREILDADRFDKALEPVVSTNRVCSTNFLIGAAEGEMIDIEAAPERANYLYPEDGILAHANHFEDRSGVESEFEKIIPHTLFRSARTRRLLAQHLEDGGEIDREAMLSVFRDHFSRPSSICRHVDEELPEQRHVQTIASLVVDLDERRMLATQGPPCESSFEEFVVSS
jgi:isopenicillin-N N-acyltransferase-like protein